MSAPAAGLDLILCWHMHQPEYRDGTTGEFVLPWVYLHAIKDYADMAAHAERHPGVRMVFNFVPVLLEQLQDYSQQFRNGRFRDPLLRWLDMEDHAALSPSERRELLRSCFRVNHDTMLHPFEPYRRLYAWSEMLCDAADSDLAYLAPQYFADLITWFHLSWTGETVRRAHPLVLQLMQHGSAFSLAQRRDLLTLLGRVVQDVLPRYRRLQERGQIEASTTPYFHPIVPLLLDFACAQESCPEAVLPQRAGYPGGKTRAQQQLQDALSAHVDTFGVAPEGVWPAEGAISTDTANLLAATNLRWMASGENVLVNSLKRAQQFTGTRESYLYTPYRVGSGERAVACFFRDDKLSDRVGFEYAKWHADSAVPDFIGELERIVRDGEVALVDGGTAAVPEASQARERPRPLVTIILDGENAWEYYPFNGYYFLAQLYTTLENHPFIRTTTPARWLQRTQRSALPRLNSLNAGSWVYGTLSTWIGSPAKNRAWELLCDAKRAYDSAWPRLAPQAQQRAARQLGVCEGSDWFWWFGDYNPAQSVASFDALFRANLRNLYRELGLAVPAEVELPINSGAGGEQEAGGVMRRSA